MTTDQLKNDIATIVEFGTNPSQNSKSKKDADAALLRVVTQLVVDFHRGADALELIAKSLRRKG